MKNKKTYTAREFRESFTKGKRGKAVKRTEELEQSNVCAWIKKQYPDLLYTVDMGGVSLTPAQTKIHRQRCRRGHPDMMIQEWYKDIYCGLAIEFKKFDVTINDTVVSKDKHLQEQYNYLMALRNRGWMAVFVCGEQNAKSVIKYYLEAGANSIRIINQFVYPKI